MEEPWWGEGGSHLSQPGPTLNPMTNDIDPDRDHTTAVQAWCADTPAPPGTITTGPWSQWEGDDYIRSYTTHTDHIGPATVHTAGIQHNDGRTEPYITTTGIDGQELTPAQARGLAAALLDAAGRIAT